MVHFFIRILAVVLLVITTAGCTVNEEKNIFQMARVNQSEVAKIKISRAGKSIEVTDGRSISLILQPMAGAKPAADAGNTRMESITDWDYIIDILTSPDVRPARFYYNSEKQWLFFARGAKKFHPYKCEALLPPLTDLFNTVNYRAVISEEEGLPRYFNLIGWLGKNRFYGLQGDILTVWDRENGTTEPLLRDVWTMLLSPDQTRLAYTDQKGLNIFDLKTLQSVTAVKAGSKPPDGSPVPVCWAPDSDKVMYAIEHEWHSDFYVLDTRTNKSTPFVFKDVDNFLSTPVAWLKNGNILFIVSAAQPKEGARGYMPAGYRSDLMEAGPDGNFRPITAMEDYKYVSFAGLTENEKEALVIIRENNGAARKAALVDLADGNIEYLPWDNAVSAGISPDGRFAAATTPLEQDRMGYRLELFDRSAGRVIFSFESRDYTAEKSFLWHPGGKKFLYLDRSLENASKNKLRQVKILPE